jgi:endo-alpha-1,4-polygalactosaminidase (GH114 family)
MDDAESSGYVSHAMSFFSGAAWQYYLPAYLIQSIKLGRFSSLYFRESTKPELSNFQKERIKRLTADQCKVVVAYLLVVQHEDCSCEYDKERNKEAVDFWKQNYRRAASQTEG